jgi:membrane protease YdiL (CAAX protease family)
MSNPPFVPLWSIASILIAAFLGVFKRASTLGPRRLDADESPQILLVSIGFALSAWALCILLLGQAHQYIIKHNHQPPSTNLSDPETVLFSAAMDIAVFCAILFASRATRRDALGRLGLSPRRIPFAIITGAFFLLLILPHILWLSQLTDWTLNRLGKSPSPHELLEILTTNPPPWLRLADILAAGLFAPLAEELFFRGLLQTFLRYILKRPWPAIVLASMAWAFMHHWWTWPQIFFLGLCLGYVYERTGNLWATIAIHSFFNLTSIWAFTHLPS